MRIIHIISTLLIIFSVASCDKLPENGKLDGMWQIMSVNYAHGAEYDSIVNLKSEKVFLSFQLKLAQFRTGNLSNDNLSAIVYSRFKYSGSTIRFYNFYFHENHTGENESDNFVDDILLTDSTTKSLQCLGINGIAATFHIDKLDGDKMQLSSDYAQIVCRKF